MSFKGQAMDKKTQSIIDAVRDGESSYAVVGLSGSIKVHTFAVVLSRLERPCLALLPDGKEADRFYKDLGFFLSETEKPRGDESARVHAFPPYDLTPLSGLSPHRDLVTRRIEALYALMSGKNPVVVTSPEALCFRTMPEDAFVDALEYLEVGESFDRDLFIKRIQSSGYQRTSLVEEVGDYSVRGGVLDIFPPLQPYPLRLEFWGDHLESISAFDPVSQRSLDRIQEATLLPASEILTGSENIARARSMGRLPAGDVGSFPGREAWLNHFYPHLDTLLDYLPAQGILAFFDPSRIEEGCLKREARFAEEAEKFRKEASETGVPFPETAGLSVSWTELSACFDRFRRLDFSALDLPGGIRDGTKKVHFQGPFEMDEDLEVRLAGKGRVSMAPLAAKLAGWVRSGARAVLVSRTPQQAERLREILHNYGVPTVLTTRNWGEIPGAPGLYICLGRLTKGFISPDKGLYVISEDEIFGVKKARYARKKRSTARALDWPGFSQMKAGDAVVHEDHGVGRYAGLKKMEIQGRIQDFIIIEYEAGDRLYLPADRVSVLQRYVGVDGNDIKMDRLGGRSWDVAKQKAGTSVRRIAKQLVDIYALRKHRKGFAFSTPDHQFFEFEAGFEHEETGDQVKAIEDVIRDMCSERPMDRLICGDVGFGKTEVAVRAAFKAVSDGKQVAFLVPTTVLAEQHHETFIKRMTPHGIEVGLMSRFKTNAEQAETLARLRSGKVDILIGTHRILQKDVEFRELGLVMIDEEQRFGVKQKEVLKKYRSLVDVLALTATPIPRTFQMSLMGVRDLSVIETPPEDRFAIRTYLSSYDEALIARAVKYELERGGQVFFVHNAINTIGDIADRLTRLVPEARVGVAHGRMRERDLERTMLSFVRQEIRVLVCTTIIESGLDIPSANTIIINGVDRMGLAQIYQLRGRVGRSDQKAYAYLLVSEGVSLTRDAEKRLRALMDFTRLGAGLHLAMHDLKIRGGGNLLGFSQAGHIAAVGYELYMKLIEKAVSELKGEEWHDEINPEINMDIPAFLPGEYIADTDVRLNLYRRLSGLREKSELADMEKEVRDRFGPAPQEVHNLLRMMSLRLALKKMGAAGLNVGPDAAVITFVEKPAIDIEALASLVEAEPQRFAFLEGNKLKVRLNGPPALQDMERIEKVLEMIPVA